MEDEQLLFLQDLEIENVKMREDMAKLRRSIAEGAEDSENEAGREDIFINYNNLS